MLPVEQFAADTESVESVVARIVSAELAVVGIVSAESVVADIASAVPVVGCTVSVLQVAVMFHIQYRTELHPEADFHISCNISFVFSPFSTNKYDQILPPPMRFLSRQLTDFR